MMPFLHGLVRAVTETFDLPAPVLEVGSFQVPGQEAIADLRSFFPGKRYRGIDLRPGPGVDAVADVEDLPQPSESVGTVLALSTFEHVRHFWRGFDEIERVLRPDGALIVSCPFYFRLHHHPRDYWRFTPQGLEVLLENYPNRILGWHGPRRRPANVWAVAFREEHPPITAEEFTRYRTLLGQYTRRPHRWARTLRYRMGQIFFGRRPFEPYLEQDCWETECHTLAPDRRPSPGRRWRARRLPPGAATGAPPRH